MQQYLSGEALVFSAKKDDNFWSTVTQRDIAYVTLDESMNHTLATLEQQYGEIDFMGTNTSLNYSDPAQKSL